VIPQVWEAQLHAFPVSLADKPMSEDLKSALSVLRQYVDAHGLDGQISLSLEEGHVRVSLLAEGRDLWLGRRYFLVSDPTDEPKVFFDLNEIVLSQLLALPSGAGDPSSADAKGHSLFVSYSRLDEVLIVPLVDLLRVTDARVFRDRESIRAGDAWWPAIESAIAQSTECLVFWCEHAASSAAMSREMDLAIRLSKRLVPILMDDTPLDGRLRELQAVDMRQFQSHVWVKRQGPPPERSGPETVTTVPGPMLSTDSEQLRAAVEYLAQQLEKVLGVSPLLLDSEGLPNMPLQPPSGEQDVADSKA
jgi:hypothetical protein